MLVPFTKMHGAGNDYIVLDAVANESLARDLDAAALAPAWCNRHTGIGADGILILTRSSDPTQLQMHIINADGGPGGMCGNGARCVAWLAHDRGYASPAPDNRIELLVGRRLVSATVNPPGAPQIPWVEVQMGSARLGLEDLPADPRHLVVIDSARASYEIEGRPISLLSMGNPHLVIFGAQRPTIDAAAALGIRFGTHPAFPQRINVHMACVLSKQSVDVVSCERGVGVTQACGSGACAVVLAGRLLGVLGDQVAVAMPGGQLHVRFESDSHLLSLAGPVCRVFDGQIEAESR